MRRSVRRFVAAVAAGAVVGVGLPVVAASADISTGDGAAAAIALSQRLAAEGHAQLTAAAANNVAVELKGQRSEFSKTVQNPDGSLTQTVSTAPLFVPTEGGWTPTNTTLELVNGRVQPKAVIGAPSFSDGGTSTLANASIDGTDVHWSWDGAALPTPTLSGSTATYANVKPGVDLTVTATATGFEDSFVVHSEQAATQTLPITVSSAAGTVQQLDDGSMRLVDHGQEVASSPPAVEWDATKAPSGEHPNQDPLQVDTISSSGPVTDSAPASVTTDDAAVVAAGTSVSVNDAPDPSFAQDPSTVYPVVVDPSNTMSTNHYAVYRNGHSTYFDQAVNAGVGYGTLDGTYTESNRSAWSFNLSNVQGANQLTAASLTDSIVYDASSSSTEVDILNTNPVDNEAYPGPSGVSLGSHLVGHTDTSTTWNLTSFFQGQFTAGVFNTNVANLELREPTSIEGDGTHFVTYSAYPTLSITYDHPPVTGAISAPGSYGSGPPMVSAQPTFSSTATDTDTGDYIATAYAACQHSNPTNCVSGYSSTVAAGSAELWNPNSVPASLAGGVLYDVAATAYDVAYQGGGTQTLQVLVDATPPQQLTASSPDFKQDDYTADPTNLSMSGTFTFATTSSDISTFSYGLDNSSTPNALTPVVNGSGRKASVTLSVAPGLHALYYKATDNVSNPSSGVYYFAVGVGIKQPPVGARTQAQIVVQGHDDDSSVTSGGYATYYWAYPGKASNVIADHVAPTSGGDFTPVTWNVTAALGDTAADQALFLIICFHTSSGTQTACSEYRQFQYARHAFGGAYATQQLGPGTLASLTGDYAVSATDVSQPTYRGSLSVGRSFDTLSPQPASSDQPELLAGQTNDPRSFENPSASPLPYTTSANISATIEAYAPYLGTYVLGLGSTGGGGLGGGVADNFASLEGDAGAMRLGMRAGHTYSMSGHVYVPNTTVLGLTSLSTRSLRLVLFYKDSAGAYHEVDSNAPTAAGWNTVSATMTIPIGATEAFARLYLGTSNGAGWWDLWDGMSLREVGPLGVGWNASISGPDSGAADAIVGYDSSIQAVTMTAPDGSTSYFYYTGAPVGGVYYYSPDGWDAPSGTKIGLKISDTTVSPTQNTINEYDADGTVTTFVFTGSAWQPYRVSEPSANGSASTQFHLNADGRVDEIVGASAPGAYSTIGVPADSAHPACAPDGTLAHLPAGCRALGISYGSTVPTGSGTGDYVGMIKQVTFAGGYTTSDDGNHGVATPVAVANYTYDATGQLVSVTDPRTSLSTSYTYTSTAPTARLASITPPGLHATNFTFDSSGRLASIWHYAPDNITPATTTIAYGVPLHASSSTATDLPNLDGTYGSAPSAWNETDPPQASAGIGSTTSYATAVFPPDYAPSNPASPGSADWAHASITYLDTLGRQVNTASFGAGAWQIGTTQYDTAGNTTFGLTPENRDEALAPITGTTDPVVAAMTSSVSRAQLLGTQTVYSADESEVTDTYGPAHPYAYNDGTGTVADGRTHTHVDYDQGAPNGNLDPNNGNQPYRLATTNTISPCVVGVGTTDGFGCSTTSPDTRAQDTRTATSVYDAVLGGTDGWTLRTPTQNRTSTDGNSAHDIVTSSKYDSLGRTLMNETPAASQTAGDTSAHTTLSYYYDTCTGSSCSSGPQGSALPSACQGHYAYAGLPCQTAPAGQPTDVDTNHPALTTTTTTTYNLYNDPTATSETNGTVTRTTSTTYDSAGRVTDTSVATTGDSSVQLPARHTAYSASTGLPGCVTTTASCTPPSGTTCPTTSNTTVFTSYDSLGRVTCVTDASANSTGNTTTTSYDLDDRPVSVVDNKSTTTLTYNGMDANGLSEDRGLPTAENTTLSGSIPTTFTAGYNGNGAITTEKYPPATSGGTPLAYYTGYDNVGQTWGVYTQLPGSLGGTYEGASHSIFGQTTGDVQNTGYATYLTTNTYDPAGRLSSVQDAYSTSSIPLNTITRNYSYDADSNRLALTLGTSYHAQVSADSPVGYWRLGDNTSTAADASGNGHAGTYTTYSTGTPVGSGFTQQVTGTTPNDPSSTDANTAVNFTGWTNNTGGYISVPSGGSAPLANNGAFTDELWFTSPTNSSTDWPVLLGEGLDAAQSSGYVITINSGHVFYFSNTTAIDCGAIPTGHEGWHYLAVSYDGTTLRCYQDGTQTASTASTATGSPGTDPISVGADPDKTINSDYDKGSIDDLAIYSGALSADKIDQHYRLALGGYDAQAHSYDQADRLTDSGVIYDQLGRTTALPAGLTNAGTINVPNANPVTLTYFANDLVNSETQGTSTDTMCLDPLNRLSYTANTASSCTGAAGTLEHYDDTSSSGNESASYEDNLTNSTWSRNVIGLGGMAGTVDGTGNITWAVHNIHGDDSTNVADSSAATYSGEMVSNEFGTPRTDATSGPVTVGPNAYGWLGTKRRTDNDLAGLIEMGERIYDPTIGRFLQVDPVPGGSCNDYDYVCQDPSDKLDIDGNAISPGRYKKGFSRPLHTYTANFSPNGDTSIPLRWGNLSGPAWGFVHIAASHPGSLVAGMIENALLHGHATRSLRDPNVYEYTVSVYRPTNRSVNKNNACYPVQQSRQFTVFVDFSNPGWVPGAIGGPIGVTNAFFTSKWKDVS